VALAHDGVGSRWGVLAHGGVGSQWCALTHSWVRSLKVGLACSGARSWWGALAHGRVGSQWHALAKGLARGGVLAMGLAHGVAASPICWLAVSQRRRSAGSRRRSWCGSEICRGGE